MGIEIANAARLAFLAAAEVIRPPPPVDYNGFAVENIVFSDNDPFPGPYNPDLFPFFGEILAALGPDDPCRIVTLKKSAQVGGTILGTIFTVGSMVMDPCHLLYTHPTDDNGRRWSKLKLAPILRSTTALRRIFESRSRDAADSIMYKETTDQRGAILISGANSPASLSQVTMKRQVQDDLAKWETNSAGDPEGQADNRSRAHEFAKIFKISTPLVVPGCRISRNYDQGTQEILEVPCPHCDAYQALEWTNMLANLDEAEPENAHFTCTACGAEIRDHHRPAMLRRHRWVAQFPSARRFHRSFYLWSAYSLLQSFETIAREWIKAKGDPSAEQVFLNDTVGLAYEAQGEAPPWEELRDRAETQGHDRGLIPAGHPVLTIGIDCQKDRVEGHVVAFGRDRRRAVVDYFVVAGHISEADTQTVLDGIIGQTWCNASGRRIGVDRVAIDGNAFTEDVFGWVKRHPRSKVIMVRGDNRDTAPLVHRVKREKNPRTGKTVKYGDRFFNVNVSVLKMALYRNAKKTDPQARGYIAFPKGLGDEYFLQLTAERRVEEKNRDGFPVYRWKKDPAQANEGLDTMLQAEAAAINFNVREFAESRWDMLEAERETPQPGAQLDIEDLPLVRAAAPTPPPTTPTPSSQKPARRTLSQMLKNRRR